MKNILRRQIEKGELTDALARTALPALLDEYERLVKAARPIAETVEVPSQFPDRIIRETALRALRDALPGEGEE